jgi:hypothetical protein
MSFSKAPKKLKEFITNSKIDGSVYSLVDVKKSFVYINGKIFYAGEEINNKMFVHAIRKKVIYLRYLGNIYEYPINFQD